MVELWRAFHMSEAIRKEYLYEGNGIIQRRPQHLKGFKTNRPAEPSLRIKSKGENPLKQEE